MPAMPEFRCATCGTYHEPPRCAHKPDAVCSACRRPVGFLGYGQPRDGRCNRCFVATDLGIVVRDCAPPAAPAADWLGDLG